MKSTLRCRNDPGDDLSNESDEQSAEARLLEKYGFNPGVRSVVVNRAGRTYLLNSDSIPSEFHCRATLKLKR